MLMKFKLLTAALAIALAASARRRPLDQMGALGR